MKAMGLRTVVTGGDEPAMLALLGDGRTQVSTDAERGFRVEGIFELSLMDEPPRSNHASEGACVVAGEWG